MSPIVCRPEPASFSAAFGPTPLTLRAASGQMRAGMSACVSRVRPPGLSNSEQIFDSSLFGVTPIEQLRPPVASRTASFSAVAIARPPSARAPGTSVRSM